MKLEMTKATCSLTYIIYICIYVNRYDMKTTQELFGALIKWVEEDSKGLKYEQHFMTHMYEDVIMKQIILNTN